MKSDSDPVDVEQDAAETEKFLADQTETASKGGRIISKVLAPAVRLWLRSQVEDIQDLQVDIEAGDRELLSGQIQRIRLSARKAVYRGLHLTRVDLMGQTIRVNLGQILRGKPLRLLAPIPIEGTLLLQEDDLSASANAPLLKAGVAEFLATLLRSSGSETEKTALNLQNLKIRLEENYVVVAASLVSVRGTDNAIPTELRPAPIAIRTGFEMGTPNVLKLVKPQWLPHANAKRGLEIADLDGYEFNLGKDTEIQDLKLEQGQMTCRAKLWVRS
ncbi:DUF2993 domain-containing protein [Myxacorys almedinensis]|uniref:LmeA family phospholipid-binding protein n=1 Tax=Myxacorys almedinensis A TaxID=2690445 RepID=A0A8J7Z243_9CYAN|nr:DUF2993 domain-containing protein [Myxacorys almedinensis]NDJ16771.1 LmeA family phospholipid-binding protein [Myxacorys almedinensis A]